MKFGKRRGLAIVTFSMVAAVAVPFFGMAMDAAMLCVIKERLTTAVDSAASAAAKYPEAGVNRESAAMRFLDANFPEAYMGTGERKMVIDGERIEVRVAAPTFFMKLLHVRSVEVAAAQRISAPAAQH